MDSLDASFHSHCNFSISIQNPGQDFRQHLDSYQEPTTPVPWSRAFVSFMIGKFQNQLQLLHNHNIHQKYHDRIEKEVKKKMKKERELPRGFEEATTTLERALRA